MNQYMIIAIEYVLAISGILALLGCVLWMSTRNRRATYRGAGFYSEELETNARKTAIEHVLAPKHHRMSWPLPRLNNSYDCILSVYSALGEDIRKGREVPAAAEWLLDNFYVVESQVKILRRELTKKDCRRLPVLRSGPFQGYARIFAIAAELIARTAEQPDETALSSYLKTYQSHSVLFEREIRAMPLSVRLAVIDGIRQLCERVRETNLAWRAADKAYLEFINATDGKLVRYKEALAHGLQTANHTVDSSFAEHLCYCLRRSGQSHAAAIASMNEFLARMGTSVDEIMQKEHNAQSLITVSMGNYVTSLHRFASLDWSELFRTTSHVEQILEGDPHGTYCLMDLATRSRYRETVEELALIHHCSEIHVAREAISLATAAWGEGTNNFRTEHVGYYLIDDGLALLIKRISGKKQHRVTTPHRQLRPVLYIGSVLLTTAVLVSAAMRYGVYVSATHHVAWRILSGLAVAIPASEIALRFVNRLICRVLKPVLLPKMELKTGIPERFSTVVVMPTLLPDEDRVGELLATMEGHYLRNRDDNLYFALLGAFRDADQPHLPSDDGIIDAAMRGVKALNEKYTPGKAEKFYFFHRERQFNESNHIWIGWERKRGALMEFNELALGNAGTSFVHASSPKPSFEHIKYIITLDSDTLLPMGMAKRLIGTMAHPLNRPMIDRKKGIVTKGFGLLQPRIDIDVESAGATRFSRIFTTQDGIDPYSGAISDVYQDMFGEGSYTGKGIYDLRVFQTVLQNTIPENTVLSHDLLEGSYMRTGLATDLNLVDGFPAAYRAYAARLHRWTRGDWQLFPRLFRKIHCSHTEKIANPLSVLSKWKIFDNLRRSVLAPAFMVLAVLSVTVLPGSLYLWIGAMAVTALSPLVGETVGAFVSLLFGNRKTRQ
ncbi:MAG: glycosyl transferase, partial [Oscillospiraceae bacterium]|nr:glycosyl transferase [Oscillospiraceae bacterium]